MAYTPAQNRATQKYIKENLEEVRFRVRKGEKAHVQAEAAAQGVSMARYITEAINAYAGRTLLTVNDQDSDQDKKSAE